MNRLDENQKTTLSSLDFFLDFYNKRIWLRVLVHMAFFSYFTYFMYYRYYANGIIKNGFYFWVFCCFNIISYYYIFNYLIFNLLVKKQYFLVLFLFFLWYFIPYSYVCFKYNEEIELLNNYPLKNLLNINKIWIEVYSKFGLWGHFVSFIFFYNVFQEFASIFFIFGFLRFIKYYLDNLVKERKIYQLNYILETKYLLNQLNPHFLFNSLNNLYGLILQKNKDTPQIISQFQNLLDHTLQQSDNSLIPLEIEIEYLKNYINLEKIRHGNKLFITHNFDILIPKNLKIAPRILLPFIENAFKHSAYISIEEVFININLKIDKSDIEFEVKNNYPLLDKKQNITGGIGLKNVRRRLDLIYPKYNLTISNEDSIFTIVLKINL